MSPAVLKPHIETAWDTVRRSLAVTGKVCMFTVFIRLSDKDIVFMPPIGVPDKEAYKRLIAVAAQQIECDLIIMAFEADVSISDQPDNMTEAAIVQWKSRDGEEGCELRHIDKKRGKRIIGQLINRPDASSVKSKFFEDIFKPTLH